MSVCKEAYFPCVGFAIFASYLDTCDCREYVVIIAPTWCHAFVLKFMCVFCSTCLLIKRKT